MIIDFADLEEIRKKHSGQKIVLASGCFDLTHAGHILYLEDCKKYGDILIAMVGTDLRVKRNKGEDRPIFNEQIRIKIIDSLKPVDYSFFEPFLTDEKHPLDINDGVFKKLKPDFCIVNEDSSDIDYLKKIGEKNKVNIIVLKRWSPSEYKNISTSEIIKKLRG